LPRDSFTPSKDANGHANKPARGWDSATVPGAVAAWGALHERFGKLPFGDLLQPAIAIAERGYAVSPIVAHKWAANALPLAKQPGFADAFMPRGRAPHIGEKSYFQNGRGHVAHPRGKRCTQLL
jgi:gamma-glutamyltranspeptidase / glutathione hydrolase